MNNIHNILILVKEYYYTFAFRILLIFSLKNIIIILHLE